MIEIKHYRRVESLEEAWELNQKRRNRVIGGMLWLKQGRASVDTAIDLSGLGLDHIEEERDSFRIGCMASLRLLETHEGLNRFASGALRDAFCNIVGVQFRNLATVGGSIWGRYGFSDVLTIFMALGAEAELFRGGRVPLSEFASMKKDRDILTHILVPKEEAAFAYLSVRNTRTDLPVLNAAAALSPGGRVRRLVIGARPQKAVQLSFPEEICLLGAEKNGGTAPWGSRVDEEALGRAASFAAEATPTGDNLRGSAAYRTRLVGVLSRRVLLKALGAGPGKGEVEPCWFR